jgi:riboflavin synthase
MFTGIVQGQGELKGLEDHVGGRRLRVHLPEEAQGGLQPGASISVAGVCLTVVEFGPDWAQFDVIAESLRLTTLGDLQVGDPVNIERAARMGAEIGGHILSGHISGMATILERQDKAEETMLRLQLPEALQPYVLAKGYVAVDGVSLTVGRLREGSFTIHLIPETLRRTTLDRAEVGAQVNIELDAMTQAVVDTVERVLAQRSESG